MPQLAKETREAITRIVIDYPVGQVYADRAYVILKAEGYDDAMFLAFLEMVGKTSRQGLRTQPSRLVSVAEHHAAFGFKD